MDPVCRDETSTSPTGTTICNRKFNAIPARQDSFPPGTYLDLYAHFCNIILCKHDMLIKIFIPLRQAKAITWGNFVPAKRDPGSTKEGSRPAGMKLFPCNRRI